MEQSTIQFGAPLREVYSVSRLNREAKRLLETGFPALWIEAEISNLAKPSSGHWYFHLKDGESQVRCALFRGFARLMQCTPKDGMRVLVRARVSLYEGRGEFQLLVEHLEESGEGALRRAFEALKTRLAQEGLFDAGRKRPLPLHPRRVGIITSPTGAAVRDIVTTFRRRFPAIALLVYPVPVQGTGAAEKIARGIALAGARGECDALILARGGGSLEDLWPFNEEIVARAIVQCPIPIVSGIGHEIDLTIADLAADVRAPTPTAAAELLSGDCLVLAQQFADYAARCRKLMARALQESTQRVDWLSARLIHPQARLQVLQHRLTTSAARLTALQTQSLAATRIYLANCTQRLRLQTPRPRIAALSRHTHSLSQRHARALQALLERKRARLLHRVSTLEALSPLGTLTRGYAIVEKQSGAIVRAPQDVAAQERLTVKLAQGQLVVSVHDRQND